MRPIMTAAELAAHMKEHGRRNHRHSCDGYDDMDIAGHDGWHPVTSWGRDGWDLGKWPYVVIYTRDAKCVCLLPDSREVYAHEPDCTGPVFELMQIVEGDHTIYRFRADEDRDAAIDYMFSWYAADEDWAPLSYADRHLLDHGVLFVDDRWRGPFSWSRLEREKQ